METNKFFSKISNVGLKSPFIFTKEATPFIKILLYFIAFHALNFSIDEKSKHSRNCICLPFSSRAAANIFLLPSVHLLFKLSLSLSLLLRERRGIRNNFRFYEARRGRESLLRLCILCSYFAESRARARLLS